MTPRDEILRRIELKRQAMTILEESLRDRMAQLRADIQSLHLQLRELDYAEKSRTETAAA